MVTELIMEPNTRYTDSYSSPCSLAFKDKCGNSALTCSWFVGSIFTTRFFYKNLTLAYVTHIHVF
jgi:hypothetical protein